jgi:hypothetical protein
MNPTPTTRVLTRIRVECVDGDRWRVLEPFVVVTQRLGRIEVPAGFITDFNSTPRLLWNVLPPTECAEASVPHDLLYQRGELADVKVSQQDADAVHAELVAWIGSADDPATHDPDVPPRQPVAAWRRRAYAWGLWIGGGVAWAKYRRQAATARTAAPAA